jgi:MoxR-like ATPase
MEDVPGIGKTMLAKAISALWDLVLREFNVS